MAHPIIVGASVFVVASAGTALAILDDSGIQISSLSALGILAGSGTVIAFLFRALISSKDKELASVIAANDAENKLQDKALLESESRSKSWEEMANESSAALTKMANFVLQKDGKMPLVVLAPVISESHSPSTEAQRATARIQTMRALIADVKLRIGDEPRPEPERAIE